MAGPWGMLATEVAVRSWRMTWWVAGAVWLGGCREYQEPLSYEDCQPYQLECALCTYEEDVAEAAGLRRAWRCETPEGDQYDAVLRDGDLEEATDDVHYYDPDKGSRLAAERRFSEPTEVCGEEQDVEWYGEILEDCEVVCELDGTLPEADDSAELCDG